MPKPKRIAKPVRSPPLIGTAGWSLPLETRDQFGAGESLLQRYASRLNCAEINSSFYRPHRPATYARWADSVPADFRFSVKAPRAITHDKRLVDVEASLTTFLAEATSLGEKLGCLLVQLPPKLSFENSIAASLFSLLREHWQGGVACEPRHASWFTTEADELLSEHKIGRVAADPVKTAAGSEVGGWPRLAYYRLHGSPRIYYSNYEADALADYAAALKQHAAAGHETWCIFDNTASGAATANALEMHQRVR